MSDDLERAKLADRSYRDGFLQACREWAQHLSERDGGSWSMIERCHEISAAYERNRVAWGLKP